jgi:hypothetical protein
MADLAGCKVAILVDDGFEKVELVKPRQALDDAAPRPPSGGVASKRAGVCGRVGTRDVGGARHRHARGAHRAKLGQPPKPVASSGIIMPHIPPAQHARNAAPSAQALEQLGRPSERHQMVHPRSR